MCRRALEMSVSEDGGAMQKLTDSHLLLQKSSPGGARLWDRR